MKIRILTCHPALRYVLNRTAPVGTTVRADQPAPRERDALCQIEIESRINEAEVEARVLEAWLPDHVLYYGARSIEINGRRVGCAENELRHALRPATERRKR
jgi:hypothetical protein